MNPVDQRADVQVTAGNASNDFLEIASFGPADVGEGIVDAPFLVVGVVAAGAVGGGDQEVQLLGVNPVPLNPDRNVSDEDDPPLAAARLEATVQERGVAARGRDDHGVGSVTVGALEDPIDEASVRHGEAARHSQRAGALHAIGPHVDACDDRTVCAEQLGRELTDQAQSDDRHAVPEGRRRAPNPLEGDRPERGEGALREGDFVRKAGEQIHGDRVDGCVIRVAGAPAGNPVSPAKPGDPGRHLDDGPGRRIPDRLLAGNPGADQFDRAPQAPAGHAVHDLAHEMRVA